MGALLGVFSPLRWVARARRARGAFRVASLPLLFVAVPSPLRGAAPVARALLRPGRSVVSPSAVAGLGGALGLWGASHPCFGALSAGLLSVALRGWVAFLWGFSRPTAAWRRLRSAIVWCRCLVPLSINKKVWGADARFARSRVALLGAPAGAPLRGASLARLRSFSRRFAVLGVSTPPPPAPPCGATPLRSPLRFAGALGAPSRR